MLFIRCLFFSLVSFSAFIAAIFLSIWLLAFANLFFIFILFIGLITGGLTYLYFTFLAKSKAFISDLISSLLNDTESTFSFELTKEKKYPTPPKYSQPFRLLRYWQANMAYAKRKSIVEKIALAQRISKKNALQQFYLLRYH